MKSDEGIDRQVFGPGIRGDTFALEYFEESVAPVAGKRGHKIVYEFLSPRGKSPFYETHEVWGVNDIGAPCHANHARPHFGSGRESAGWHPEATFCLGEILYAYRKNSVLPGPGVGKYPVCDFLLKHDRDGGD